LKALIFLGFQKNGAWQRILRAIETKTSATIEAQIKFLLTMKPFHLHRDTWLRLWYAIYGDFEVSPEDSTLILHKKKQHQCTLPWMRAFMNKLEGMQDTTLNAQREMLFYMAAMRDVEVNRALLGQMYRKVNDETTHETLISSLIPLVKSHVTDENLNGVEKELATLLPHLTVAFELCGLSAWSKEVHEKYFTVEPIEYEKVTRLALQRSIETGLRQKDQLLQTVDRKKLDVNMAIGQHPEILAELPTAKKGQLRQLLKRVKEDIEVLSNNQMDEVDHFRHLQSRLAQLTAERIAIKNKLNWRAIHTSSNPEIKTIVDWTVPKVEGQNVLCLAAAVESLEKNVELLRPHQIPTKT
jgi:hypothetical protein